MQTDMFCFKLSHDRNITVLYVKPPSRAKLQGGKKMVPAFQFVCQQRYLSSRVSLLIKMNGRLMTGVVSFNVTFVFIFHPNIPLSEDSRVYETSLADVQGYNHHSERQPQPFLTLSFCRSLYLSIAPCHALLPFCFTISALRCLYHQRRIDAIASGPDYVTRDESFSTLSNCCFCKRQKRTGLYITSVRHFWVLWVVHEGSMECVFTHVGLNFP